MPDTQATFDHVPTREEVLAALAKMGFDDLDDLAEAVVAEARDAAKGDEKADLDIWNTPWGHFIHSTATEEA